MEKKSRPCSEALQWPDPNGAAVMSAQDNNFEQQRHIAVNHNLHNFA